MKGGVIKVEKAKGDVYFVTREGKEVLDPLFGVEVQINKEFPGITLKDSMAEAQRFAIGAIVQKMQQNIRGKYCFPIVRNIDVSYKIRFGFRKENVLQRDLEFKAGEQILKKGEHGDEFFWVKDGIIEIDKVFYQPGSVFGRAAFSDGVRKKNAYAKTDVELVAVNREHPDIVNKLPLILEKFSEEVKNVRRVRPKARLEKIKI